MAWGSFVHQRGVLNTRYRNGRDSITGSTVTAMKAISSSERYSNSKRPRCHGNVLKTHHNPPPPSTRTTRPHRARAQRNSDDTKRVDHMNCNSESTQRVDPVKCQNCASISSWESLPPRGHQQQHISLNRRAVHNTRQRPSSIDKCESQKAHGKAADRAVTIEQSGANSSNTKRDQISHTHTHTQIRAQHTGETFARGRRRLPVTRGCSLVWMGTGKRRKEDQPLLSPVCLSLIKVTSMTLPNAESSALNSFSCVFLQPAYNPSMSRIHLPPHPPPPSFSTFKERMNVCSPADLAHEQPAGLGAVRLPEMRVRRRDGGRGEGGRANHGGFFL